ncbi:MAG TPA: hypothetical protein VEW04_06495 [Allosphingosinicella sp.]|nr:hypothetical protein [Allosphingosinicella sp.]
MIAKPMLALAAAALLAGSTAASAQSAAPLSLAASPAAQRAGAPAHGQNDLRGGYGWILAIAALGILAFVITELGNDNSLPGSP